MNVYESGKVIVKSSIVIENEHTTYAAYPIVSISNIHVAYLGDPTIEVVIDRNVFYLDYRTVIIILRIRTIVKTWVEGYSVSSSSNIILNVEIELPIWIYWKRNAIFNKNKWVVVPISIARCNLIFYCTFGQDTCSAQNYRRKKEY